MSVKQTTLGPP